MDVLLSVAVVGGLAGGGAVYAVARARIGAGRALLAAGGSYLVVVLGVAAMIYASLDTM